MNGRGIPTSTPSVCLVCGRPVELVELGAAAAIVERTPAGLTLAHACPEAARESWVRLQVLRRSELARRRAGGSRN